MSDQRESGKFVCAGGCERNYAAAPFHRTAKGKWCNGCLAADRIENRRRLAKIHPAIRFRLMLGLPLLPDDWELGTSEPST